MALAAPAVLLGPRRAGASSDEQPFLIRVLIRRPDSSPDAASMTVSGDGEIAISDANGEVHLKAPARRQVTIGREGDGFWVRSGDDKRITGLAGPIRVNGTGDGAPLRNQATSGAEPTAFRGTLEVTASGENRVALVNVLGIEEYLYGVVTKELPASFGAEPLKAQAVAARTYALARRQIGAHKAQGADICDTQHCQAFAGLSGELAAGRAAVDDTRGKILLRGGSAFEPLYSSACGGHTETAGRIFGSDGSDGDAVADGEIPGGTELGSDAGALKFFKNAWDSNCSRSDKYRWSYTWDADQLKAMVAAGLQRYRDSSSVSASSPDARVELIEHVSVPERGASGRALSVRFEAPGVSWTVRRDWGIRQFLRAPDGTPLPSSAIALDTERGADGKIAKLTIYGAGWGHGSGMCQWGTRGLAARGLAWDAILGHYFPSAEVAVAKRA